MSSVMSIAGDAHYFEETVNTEKIRKMLNNPSSGSAAVSDKTHGMKYLLAMISKGHNVAMFYADVVKNVIVTQVELKKLVYMYLVHHADADQQCRELSLLAINSFQRDLANKNQLIRGLALRVMTSIPMRDILQIQVMAIRKASADVSPYVRKTAAHSISKIFDRAGELRTDLVEIVSRLLADSSTMVLCGAMAAFAEVCSTRHDLLHPHYRKLVSVLADMDEWGQVVAMNCLLRYARTQFNKPLVRPSRLGGSSAAAGAGAGRPRRAFYSSGDSSSSEEDNNAESKEDTKKYELDPDHYNFLRNTLPLLKSRNASVVLGVAAVHFYLGRAEHDSAANRAIGRALVRVMRNHREIQYVVLKCIIALAEDRPVIFEPFLKNFFITVGEPSFVRRLKLEVLSRIATEDTVSTILREFQTYVRDGDDRFVRDAIRAVGRIASALPDVADRCLRGLMGLINTSSEVVVAAAIIVIRQLLQQHPQHVNIIVRLAKKLAETTVPQARAAIVWIIGEFQSQPRVAALAPDTLRVLAKQFMQEDVVVKNQILNLAAKLSLRQRGHPQVQLLLEYVLGLCRFDADYDLRDRARLVKHMLAKGDDLATRVFLSTKPAPTTAGAAEGAPSLAVASLSHLVKHSAHGYTAIPEWRQEPVDKGIRDPAAPAEPSSRKHGKHKHGKHKHGKKADAAGAAAGTAGTKQKGFYDTTSDEDAAADSDSSSGSSGSSSGSDSGSGTDTDSDTDSSGSGSGSGSDSDSGSDSGSGSDTDDAVAPVSNLLAGVGTGGVDLLAGGGSFGAISGAGGAGAGFSAAPAAAAAVPTTVAMGAGAGGMLGLDFTTSHAHTETLVKADSGGGVQVDASYLRGNSSHGSRFVQVRLTLCNKNSYPLTGLRVASNTAAGGQQFVEFAGPIDVPSDGDCTADMHVDFDGRVPIKFELVASEWRETLKLAPPAGELLTAVTQSEADFDDTAGRLGGMHENQTTVTLGEGTSPATLAQRVGDAANVSAVVCAPITQTGTAKFAGATRHSDAAVCVRVQVATDDDGTVPSTVKSCTLLVNCDDFVMGGSLLDAVKAALTA